MTTLELPTTGPRLVSVDGRTYPLESAVLTARAEGGLALSRLAQVFANPHEQALDVVYTMPLPAEGAVLGYAVRIGERVIRGVVEPREKAEQAFERAVAEGRSAGLLEQTRDDTFQQRLGNIPPRTRVEVEIEVLQRVAALATTDALGAQWEYRFPTVVGIRYEGAPGRVRDAASLDVDRGRSGDIPTRLVIDVTVADANAKQITSPSHSIHCEPGPGGVHVTFGDGERLDRDLVLRWDACAVEAGARLVTGGGLAGDDGRYGLVTVTPPRSRATALSRDLTVLIDASGSMSGEPLDLAKQVVKDLLTSLEPGDRFELLAFATRVERLTGTMAAATPEAIRRAQLVLDGLHAGGGTEMASAIRESLKPLRQDAQRQVVLVTDGQIGFEREVVSDIMSGLPEASRVHAVGIGAAPNRSLTAAVARAGRGVELLVGDAPGASEAACRLRAATARPVITAVTIQGTALQQPASGRLRDVFAGQPLSAAVELRSEGGTLVVRGQLAGWGDPWVRCIEVPTVGATGADVGATPLPIGALFGREMIADLELAHAAGQLDMIDGRIEAVGMRHRIASRRTSLVAIAEEPSADPQAPKRVERIALEIPAGVSAEGSGVFAASGMLSYSLMMGAPAASASPRSSRLLDKLSVMFKRVPLPRLKEVYAGSPSPAEELRAAIEKLEEAGKALHGGAPGRLALIQVVTIMLAALLTRERSRYTRLAGRLQMTAAYRGNEAVGRRADDLFRRLQGHLDMLQALTERVAEDQQDAVRDPRQAALGFERLHKALDEITHRGHAETFEKLVGELDTLIATELKGAI